MKCYEFIVVLYGEGASEDEAWQNAVEGFVNDPGTPAETNELADLK